MSTKMKGLLKGLRYISQIFDEEKEPEMQIGFPTDVKHVAHIGWDGPSVESPSWQMKDYKGPGGYQSAPLGPPAGGESQEGPPEIKWVSEDAKSSSRNASSSARGSPEVPRSSRKERHNTENSSDSPKKESSTHKRGSRRHLKDSSDSVRSSNRQTQDQAGNPSGGSESPSAGNLPDIPKKSRRKKSKEVVNGGGSTRPSRSTKGGTTGATNTTPPSSSSTYTSPFSDPGPDTGSKKDEISQYSSSKLPHIVEEDKEKSSGVS